MPLPVGKTDVKDGSLTIRNLSPADSGLYECVATNSMGTKKAKINVVVQQLLGLCCFRFNICLFFVCVCICLVVCFLAQSL